MSKKTATSSDKSANHKESPMQTVKRLYGSKDKLVDSIVSAAKEVGDSASDAKERLATVSNQKLLRIAEVSRTVKEKYGNRDKMTSVLADAVGKAKDSDYLEKVRSFSTAKLLDLASSAERRKNKRA